MLSATRFAAVGVVGRPLTHVVRDAFCEGDEGIAEVREQHRYPPSALAVRECSENVVGVHAQCGGTLQRGSAASWRPCNVVWPHQGPVHPQLKAVRGAVCPM